MSILTVIKKIGDKIISVVEWPIKHSSMLVDFFRDAKKDYPATKSALVGFIQRIEALGPDALAALASKGFDVPDDLKTLADLKGLFSYVKDTLLPTIEADYADFLKDSADPAPPVSTVPAIADTREVPAIVPSPGLHAVTAD